MGVGHGGQAECLILPFLLHTGSLLLNSEVGHGSSVTLLRYASRILLID